MRLNFWAWNLSYSSQKWEWKKMFQRFQILVLFESLLKTEEDRLEIATRKWTSEEIEDNEENAENFLWKISRYKFDADSKFWIKNLQMRRKKLREASKAPRQQRRVNFSEFRKEKAKKSFPWFITRSKMRWTSWNAPFFFSLIAFALENSKPFIVLAFGEHTF
jgi:hypothetical protein